MCVYDDTAQVHTHHNENSKNALTLAAFAHSPSILAEIIYLDYVVASNITSARCCPFYMRKKHKISSKTTISITRNLEYLIKGIQNDSTDFFVTFGSGTFRATATNRR